MKKFIIYIFLLLIFSKCYHKIDYLKGDIKQTPVVNCFFTPDSIFKVYLGLTSEIFQNQQTTIDDATVKIISEADDTIPLHKINDYLYVSDSTAKRGVNYKLLIKSDKYGKITAENKIPTNKPTIKTATYVAKGIFNLEENMFFDQVFLKISDIKNEKNFYELSVFSKNITEIENTGDTLYILAPATKMYSSDAIIKNENYGDIKSNHLLFSDVLFSNQNINLSVNLLVRINNWNTGHYEGDIILILKNVSEDYYLYRKSLLLHKDEISNESSLESFSNMLFITQKVEVHSNIVGGIGIFAGYNSDCIYIIHNPPGSDPNPI